MELTTKTYKDIISHVMIYASTFLKKKFVMYAKINGVLFVAKYLGGMDNLTNLALKSDCYAECLPRVGVGLICNMCFRKTLKRSTVLRRYFLIGDIALVCQNCFNKIMNRRKEITMLGTYIGYIKSEHIFSVMHGIFLTSLVILGVNDIPRFIDTNLMFSCPICNKRTKHSICDQCKKYLTSMIAEHYALIYDHMSMALPMELVELIFDRLLVQFGLA